MKKNYYGIKLVSKEEGEKFINDWLESKEYVGIDNSGNNCNVEVFKSKKECCSWLYNS